jgi:hypothetical protein
MSVEDYAALPDMLKVRELRYKISRSGSRTRDVTLVTTLLDAKAYAAAELARLYCARWEVESDLKHLKQTMKMDVLKCKRVAGVLKELTVYAMVYNMVCMVMAEAARRQEVAANRISFVDALRWLLDSKSGDELVPLKVNPDRSGRVEPRVRKRRPKEFPVMKKPRSEWRKQLMGNAFAD